MYVKISRNLGQIPCSSGMLIVTERLCQEMGLADGSSEQLPTTSAEPVEVLYEFCTKIYKIKLSFQSSQLGSSPFLFTRMIFIANSF